MTQISIIEFYAKDDTKSPHSSWHIQTAEVYDPTRDYEDALFVLGDQRHTPDGEPMVDKDGLFVFERIRDETKRHRVIDVPTLLPSVTPWRNMTPAEKGGWMLMRVGRNVRVWQDMDTSEKRFVQNVCQQRRLPAPLSVRISLPERRTYQLPVVTDIWDCTDAEGD